jgi:hypothetical protein
MLHGNGTQLGVEGSAIQKPSLTTRMANEGRVLQYILSPCGLSAARTEMIGGHDFLTYSQFTQQRVGGGRQGLIPRKIRSGSAIEEQDTVARLGQRNGSG